MSMPLWLAADPLVLASRSKIRQMMLQAAGIPVEVDPADIDERGVEAGAPAQEPQHAAALLARKKALRVAARHPGRLVLGADQVLALGSRRFDKPPDRVAARAQLRELAGQTHQLHSAIAFVQNANVVFELIATAHLTMRLFSELFLERYLDAVGSAATTSVGGYQLEGLGIQLFERIEGDYFTILGLPLLQALAFLRRDGRLRS